MLAGDVAKALDVSRETLERLDQFVGLLQRWNGKINLVSKATLSEVWVRHILDSAQLLRLAPEKVGRWLDLGSGGGLPGLVVAIIGQDNRQIKEVVLVESDARKAVFLSEVKRQLGLSATVLNGRIEDMKPQGADVISARALADLDRLFTYSLPHCSQGTCLLFPKGASFEDEIVRARISWEFSIAARPSLTDDRAAVLKIEHLKKKEN